MDRGQRDRNLMERRQALVAQSTLNRLALRLEVENLGAAAARLDRAAAIIRRFGPWLLALVSVGGLIAGRSLRGRRGKLASLMSLFRLAPPLLSLWRRYASGVNSGHDDDRV